jgi:CRP-like cAMP-binding protein
MPVDPFATLQSAELFRDLNSTVLTELAANVVERRLQRDEILFVAGETARGLYVVASGSVRAYRTASDGREQIVHTEHAVATIGELPLFDGQPYPSTVAADEDCVVLFLEKQTVLQMCKAYPDIPMAALRVLSRRLRKCAELVETLSLRAVGQRIAQWFLDEAKTRGHALDGGGVIVELALSRDQLATRVGSVREVVSRAMARLDEEGLIHIQGRRVLIPDVQRLAEYSGAL